MWNIFFKWYSEADFTEHTQVGEGGRAESLNLDTYFLIGVITFFAGGKVMQHAQYQFLQSRGWTPQLPPAEAGSQRLIFAFGARQLLKVRALTGQLRERFQDAMKIG